MRVNNAKGYFSEVRTQRDGSFCVTMGYTVNQEDTVTDRKVYKSLKKAHQKADKFLN